MPATFPRGTAIYPRWTDEQLATPGLFEDGTLRGWVKRPSAVWTPDDELLYQPPDAVKSGDFERVGTVEEFEPHPFDEQWAWYQGQVRQANAYRERVLGLIRAGKVQLTSALRAWLGLDADALQDRTLGILERQRMTARAAVGTYKAATDLEAMIRATGPDPSTVNVKAIASAAAERFAATGDLAGALEGIFRSVRGQPAPLDADTGMPIIR